MVKILGAFLVICSCGIMGMMIAKNYSRRSDQFRQMQFALQTLETEIIYAANPLPVAMNLAAQQISGPVAKIFQSVCDGLGSGQGLTAAEAWQNAINTYEAYLAMNPSDIMILRQFGQGLGASDREDQLKRITLTRNQLSHIEKEAETERSQFQKVWQSLGWATGIVISMLFI